MSFAIEHLFLTKSGVSGWSLLFVKEHWWVERTGEDLRAAHWAKLLGGSRVKAWDWLHAEQRRLIEDSRMTEAHPRHFD